jgi:cell division septation protein DedD
MQDFDGAVIMDKYGLNSAPSWVILDSEGNVKQKWAGEWKNPHVKPETPLKTEEVKPEAKPIPFFKPSPAAPAASNTPSGTATAKETAKASPAMPVEKSEIVTAPPAPKAEVSASGFVLQAGYFGSEANASKLVSDLKGKGFEQYMIKTTIQNGTTFFRVVSGTFTSEAEANKQLQSLSGAGFKASVKKTTEI